MGKMPLLKAIGIQLIIITVGCILFTALFFTCGAAPVGYKQSGLATYYDGTQKSETDHPMASGVWFDRNRMEAAHRTLPFGTVVGVTRIKTGQSAIVVITDRGPCARNSVGRIEGRTRGCPAGRDVDTSRIIDFTPVAAQALGMVELNNDNTVGRNTSGLAQVSIEVVELGTCYSWGSCKREPFKRGELIHENKRIP